MVFFGLHGKVVIARFDGDLKRHDVPAACAKGAILTHNRAMKRILIVGCGDIALRVAPLLRRHCQLFGLVRSAAHFAVLRKAHIVPMPGDLDDRASLARIAGLADVVLHFAPPPSSGECDPRTRNLLAALSHGALPQRLVYISTSGVYGDCGGAYVSETHRLNAQNARARRRMDAEKKIRNWAQRNGVNASILRVPGIYANDDCRWSACARAHQPSWRKKTVTPTISMPMISPALSSPHCAMPNRIACITPAMTANEDGRIFRLRGGCVWPAAPATPCACRSAACRIADDVVVHERIAAPQQCTHEGGIKGGAALSEGRRCVGGHQPALLI